MGESFMQSLGSKRPNKLESEFITLGIVGNNCAIIVIILVAFAIVLVSGKTSKIGVTMPSRKNSATAIKYSLKISLEDFIIFIGAFFIASLLTTNGIKPCAV